MAVFLNGAGGAGDVQPAAAAQRAGDRSRYHLHGRHHDRRRDGAQTVDQLPKTLLTLAVEQNEAESVLYASSNGELSFGLLTEDSKVGPSQGVTDANLFR